MKYLGVRSLASLSVFLAAPILVQAQITGGSCTASSLNGTYSLTFNGRAISSTGSFVGSYQSVGSATFDGQSKVTFTVMSSTATSQNKANTYSGSYTIPSNCFGTATIAITGSPAAFTLVVWNNGGQFNITGSDGTYAYSGSGSSQPPLCAVSTLSGEFTFTMSGFTISSGAIAGVSDESGVLQFDGQGNLTATYTTTSGLSSTPNSSKGTYTVSSSCVGTATLTDSFGTANAINFSITNALATAFDISASNSRFVRSGTGHAAFLNPSQSIANVASYAVAATPPGSVFALFGLDLATRPAGAITTTLPTTLLNTTVTVNGEKAPLFYVDSGQIDAQMPWDIPGGAIASVIVTNGANVSNAAAVYVPAAGTPGLSVYANNRAVVVNVDGNVNSASQPAKVGDEVVAYFTGGGPVQASGKLITGSPAPSGLAPVTGTNSVTVGNVGAKVIYCGLTPGGIGLYQLNFIVPQLTRGTYPVILTINGVQSNAPVMNVN